MRIDIKDNDVRRFYESGLSSLNISRRYACAQKTILDRLHKMGVKLREKGVKRRNDITEEKLKKLYIQRKLGTWEIERIKGWPRSTVHRKLKEYNIPIRTLSESHIKYKRVSFSGDRIEKAYLIGFSIGDLRVRKQGGSLSETIKADCGSTKKDQIDLIRNLSSPYGRVWISNPNVRNVTQIEAFLDNSFDFLLNARNKIEWLLDKRKHFFPFLAGFIDAEGSFFLTRNRAGFSIGNYDRELLDLIKNKLQEFGIEVPRIYTDRKFRKVFEIYTRKGYYHSLRINKKNEILKLIEHLEPYIKHNKRRNDMERIRLNIIKRNGGLN